MRIAQNIAAISSKLPGHVQLVAVSKHQPVLSIAEAYAAGHRHFGENRVQELVEKSKSLPADIKWHMIGHLQTNKVKLVLPIAYLIHSVDRLSLLDEINAQAAKRQKPARVLLQVHIANEETKFGFEANEMSALVGAAAAGKWPALMIVGLMGMATNTEDRFQVEKEFKELNSLYQQLKIENAPSEWWQPTELSMGMSSDYETAVACGSTCVRVGSAIFGSPLP